MTISKQLYANNAKTTLASSVLPGDTCILVVDGSSFPNPTSGYYFRVTLEFSGVIEVVIVRGRSGNAFTGCIRGSENTPASGFSTGTPLGCRDTRDTFAAFARLADRLDELNSVELLSSPINSNSNSYICHSVEDSGNPILAFRNTDSTWRFPSHPTVRVYGSVSTVSGSTLGSTSLGTKLVPFVPGQYLLQYTSGTLSGTCKIITYSANNVIGWASNAPVSPIVGDTFEVYQSLSSTLSNLNNNDSNESLIFALILQD